MRGYFRRKAVQRVNPDKIFERAKRCVCKSCGGALEAKIIIYNKYGGSGLELYCPVCGKIEYGTEPDIYRLAKGFVYNVEFDYFPEMEPNEDNLKLNIAKMCEILSWHFRKLGLLDSGGVHTDKLPDFTNIEKE